jgi:hypothetical protein
MKTFKIHTVHETKKIRKSTKWDERIITKEYLISTLIFVAAALGA